MDFILLAATLGDKVDVAFKAFDLWVFHFFGTMQNDFLTIVAKFFTTYGDEKFAFMLVALGVVLCFFKKTRKYGFSLLFAMLIGTIITNAIAKPMFLRIRPYNTLQENAEYWAWYLGAGALAENDYSFPSGHTTVAFDMSTALCIALYKNKHKKYAFIPFVFAIGTMASRVYLMVHYVTDVIGGMVVGIISGIIAYYLAKLVCMLFDKVKFLNAIDAEKLFVKVKNREINPKRATAVLLVVVAIMFTGVFIPSLSEGGDAIRCDYNEEYDCYNLAKVDEDENGNLTYKEDYPMIEGHDGEYYCKIHWRQLNGETK